MNSGHHYLITLSFKVERMIVLEINRLGMKSLVFANKLSASGEQLVNSMKCIFPPSYHACNWDY